LAGVFYTLTLLILVFTCFFACAPAPTFQLIAGFVLALALAFHFITLLWLRGARNDGQRLQSFLKLGGKLYRQGFPRTWLVAFDPAPAITGTRPCATSMAIWTMRSCSAGRSVGASPVVPHAISAVAPSRICLSPDRAKASPSTAPVSSNGVGSAGA
jgi:hypothetical protein